MEIQEAGGSAVCTGSRVLFTFHVITIGHDVPKTGVIYIRQVPHAPRFM